MRKLAASAAILAATAGMALAGSATALANTDNDQTWRHHHYYDDCSSPHAINVLTCVDVLDLSNLL